MSDALQGFIQTQTDASKKYGLYTKAGLSAFVYGFAQNPNTYVTDDNFVSHIAGIAVTDPTASFSSAVNPKTSSNTVFQY